MLLRVDHINVFIQASHILREISLDVGENEVVCLVGRNGAGKSTTLRTVMGFLTPQSGKVEFLEQEISGLPTHKIAQMGISFAPEDSGIFSDLTVQENIEIGSWMKGKSQAHEDRIRLAYQVFPVLEKYKPRKGGQISGGERKMLSIARALVSGPKMLLLDEPFEGLSPALSMSVKEKIHEISKLGLSILIAESNLRHVPEFTETLYVLERGETIFSGKPDEVQNNKAVLKIIDGYEYST